MGYQIPIRRGQEGVGGRGQVAQGRCDQAGLQSTPGPTRRKQRWQQHQQQQQQQQEQQEQQSERPGERQEWGRQQQRQKQQQEVGSMEPLPRNPGNLFDTEAAFESSPG